MTIWVALNNLVDPPLTNLSHFIMTYHDHSDQNKINPFVKQIYLLTKLNSNPPIYQDWAQYQTPGQFKIVIKTRARRTIGAKGNYFFVINYVPCHVKSCHKSNVTFHVVCHITCHMSCHMTHHRSHYTCPRCHVTCHDKSHMPCPMSCRLSHVISQVTRDMPGYL